MDMICTILSLSLSLSGAPAYLAVYLGSVDSPVIVGAKVGFIALVYMRSAKGCEGVISDLDGAEVARETVVRVGLATETDLERVLLIQDIQAGTKD